MGANLLHKINTAIDTIRGYWRYLFVILICIFSRNKTSRTKNKHLCILVWEFPPSIAGGVYRPSALARYAKSSGYDVSVISGPIHGKSSSAGLKLLDYVGSDTNITRFQSPSLNPSYSIFPQIDGGFITALDMFFSARKTFREHLPDVIIATGPPFSDFVAGFFLASYLKRKLVLDYRDEWTQSPFDFVSKGRDDFCWEKRCLERADLVVFTTESQRRLLIQHYGNALEYKSIVIPNGWEPAMTNGASTLKDNKQKKAVLLFAGKLGGHTDPKQFLSTLEDIINERPELKSQFIVQFLGLKTPCAEKTISEFKFPEVIESLPAIPLNEAVKLMTEADSLLLFHDSRFERYLPGKLYEYLASGTSILLLNDNGESKKLVTELNAGWAISAKDKNSLGLALDDIINLKQINNCNRENAQSLRKDWLENHTREQVTINLLAIINNLLVDHA